MSSSRWIINGASIITDEPAREKENRQSYRVIPRGYLAVENKYIKEIGEGTPPSHFMESYKEVRGDHLLLAPGMVNTHGHAAMSLFRSYADDLPLMKWLEEKIWPIEAKLTEEEIYWGTLLSIVEMIKSGTTTFTDLYFYMEEAARAVKESGIRAVISQGLLGILDNKNEAINYSNYLFDKWHGSGEGRISIILGPHALFTCPPDYLEQVIEISQSKNMPLQIHLSESQEEFDNTVKSYGRSPTQQLNHLGFLDQPVIAAHCVHLTQEDLDIIAEKQVGVSHNPGSNLKLGSGIAPVTEMLQRGIKVGLGTDGASSNNNLDMFEEMRLAALLPKGYHQEPTLMDAPQAFKLATTGGAEVLFLNKLGKLKEGYLADLIGINLNSPRMRPAHDLLANLVYSATGSDVDFTAVNGQILMEKGELLTLDEERILAHAQELGDKLVNSS